MIVQNERDERTAAWLIEQVGAEALAEAETRLQGARKPYPSNLAKVLGLEKHHRKTRTRTKRRLNFDLFLKLVRLFQNETKLCPFTKTR